MSMSRPSRLALLAAGLLAPAAAQAHLVSTRFGDYYAGMLHPLTAFESLPWLALGLLAGLHGGPAARWLLVVFPAGVCIGALAASLLPGLPGVTAVNLLSFVALGVLTAVAQPLPAPLLAGLGALFGLSHGYDNGLALTADGNAVLFVAGIVTASYLAMALTAAGAYTLVHRPLWGAIAVRAAGSWIAAVGIMMIGLRFVPE